MTLAELFDSPARKTSAVLARNAEDLPVDPLSESAVCWCILGGLRRCYPNIGDYYAACDRVVAVIGSHCIGKWNDSASWEEVREAITKAGV